MLSTIKLFRDELPVPGEEGIRLDKRSDLWQGLCLPNLCAMWANALRSPSVNCTRLVIC